MATYALSLAALVETTGSWTGDEAIRSAAQPVTIASIRMNAGLAIDMRYGRGQPNALSYAASESYNLRAKRAYNRSLVSISEC